jgi:hypothetical protein
MKTFIFIFLVCTRSWAYQAGTYSIGFNPSFIGMLDNVTSQDNGKPNQWGTQYMYPLQVATVHEAFGMYIRPSLAYTFMPRSVSGGEVKEFNTNMAVAVGRNISSVNLDWNTHLGVWHTEYRNSGNTYTDGSGTVFHYPGRENRSRIYYIGGGLGHENDSFRLGADFNFFGFQNEDKRTLNMMLTFAWKGKWGAGLW